MSCLATKVLATAFTFASLATQSATESHPNASWPSSDGVYEAAVEAAVGDAPKILVTRRGDGKRVLEISKSRLMGMLQRDWKTYEVRNVGWCKVKNLLAFELYNPAALVSAVFVAEVADDTSAIALVAPVALASPSWTDDGMILVCMPGDYEEPPEHDYVCVFAFEKGLLIVLRKINGSETDLQSVRIRGGATEVSGVGKAQILFHLDDAKQLATQYTGKECVSPAIGGIGVQEMLAGCLKQYRFCGSAAGMFDKWEAVYVDDKVHIITWVSEVSYRWIAEGVEAAILPLPSMKAGICGLQGWEGYELVYAEREGKYECEGIHVAERDDLAGMKAKEESEYPEAHGQAKGQYESEWVTISPITPSSGETDASKGMFQIKGRSCTGVIDGFPEGSVRISKRECSRTFLVKYYLGGKGCLDLYRDVKR